MKFNGQIQDLGSKEQSVTYEMGYTGPDLKTLKEYAANEARRKGLEVLSMQEHKDFEKGWKVMMLVKSRVGIV